MKLKINKNFIKRSKKKLEIKRIGIEFEMSINKRATLRFGWLARVFSGG
jgi:hypothetical protein